MNQIFCQVFPSLGGLCKADISNCGVRKEFRCFFRGKFACCLRQMYLCTVFMVLDLRLKEDWLSGDNQFFCTCTFYCYEAQPTKNSKLYGIEKKSLSLI